MADDGAPTLNEVIGQAVRTLRELKWMAQDDLARACRRSGLQWGRSSIAMLEGGRRSCSISELLIVASALDAPLRQIVGGESLPDRPDTVMLNATTAAKLADISESLVGRAAHLERVAVDETGRQSGNQEASAWTIESGDLDQKAARRLGISTERLMSEAESLWGRSLTAERGRRTDGILFSAPDPRLALRQFRARTTRDLMKELRAALDRSEED